MTEKLWITLAWLLPKRLAYWATVRVGAKATAPPDQIAPELTVLTALERW